MKYIPRRRSETHFFSRRGIRAVDFAKAAVAEAESITGLCASDIFSPSRATRFAMARFAIWSAMHDHGYGEDEISIEFFRERSTIRHGIKKSRALRAIDGKFAEFIKSINSAVMAKLTGGMES